MIYFSDDFPPVPVALPLSAAVFFLAIFLEWLTQPGAFSRAVGRVANVAICLFLLAMAWYVLIVIENPPTWPR